MPAQELVMCGTCGRPQFAGQGTCAACGSPLPEPLQSPSVTEVSPRDRILDAYEPFLEGDLGNGRKLLLSQRRLEVSPGKPGGAQFDLAQIEEVQWVHRPIWEALVFAFAFALVAATGRVLAVRLVGVGLLTLAFAACFLQSRYAMRIKLRGGGYAQVVLGVGLVKSAQVTRAKSVWASFSTELARLGVPIKAHS